MSVIQEIEKSYMSESLPEFRAGDTVAVHYKIKEGDRERIQVFEGVVIAMKGGGARETFIVRKVSYGVGVERIFALHSPLIDKIEVKRLGKVRRAKLYYLRGLSKKASRIKERSRQDYIDAELRAKEAEEKLAAAKAAEEAEAAAAAEAAAKEAEEAKAKEEAEAAKAAEAEAAAKEAEAKEAEAQAEEAEEAPEETKAEEPQEAEAPAEEPAAEEPEAQAEAAPEEAKAEEPEAAPEEAKAAEPEAEKEEGSDEGDKEKA